MDGSKGRAPNDAGKVSAKLAEAWSQHATSVRARCRFRMRNDADAEEAFGRAWLRAVEQLRRDPEAVLDLRNWLLTIADRICIDLYRERKRRREDSLADLASTVDEGMSQAEPVADDDPERLLLQKELAAVAGGAIDALPARLHVAMAAGPGENDHRDVAGILGITDDNARKRVQEARAILRERLGKYAGLPRHARVLRRTRRADSVNDREPEEPSRDAILSAIH